MSTNRVQFEEPEYRAVRGTGPHGAFVSFLIKIGIVKNERQANYLLLGVIVVVVILTLFVLHSNGPHFTPTHYEQIPAGVTP